MPSTSHNPFLVDFGGNQPTSPPPAQPLFKPRRHRKCRSHYHMQIAHGTFVLFPTNKIQKTSILLSEKIT